MDRSIEIGATVCFGVAIAYSAAALRRRVYQPGKFNFVAIAVGFVLQTAFLWMRGKQIGRCPITNLFEVLMFVGWSVALIYILIGPVYRLSLMGAFTAPLVFVIQSIGLLTAPDRAAPSRTAVNAGLEFHASMSLIAYGAFALAGIAGVMYLVQERQLKRHELNSLFFHLPPLTTLFSAMTRLLWLGLALYSAGLLAGFFTGLPLPRLKMTAALAVWGLYAAILVARYGRRLAPTRIAAWSIGAFALALSLLWSITFVSARAAL